MVVSLPVRGGFGPNAKPSFTSARAAEQLTRDSNGWSAGADGITTVSYAFRISGDAGADTRFVAFDPGQIVATELALASWSDVADIRFVRVGSGIDGAGAYSNDATMLFGSYDPVEDDGGAAFANYPGSRSPFSAAGDVWLRADIAENTVPLVGEYGQLTLVHEIGHAIGLSHPGDYDASDDAEASYTASAGYYEDSRQYSIMSYFGSSNTGGDPPVFAAAPQLDDIAAVQRLYGANYATRAGDTTYGFNSNAGRAYYAAADADTGLYFAVWDGGGYDRLDFSGYRENQTIDLRQGAFSSVGGSIGNVAIAVGVTIEEAIGGGGDDTLIANDSHDVLIGGAGRDSILGGAGNDHLFGGGRTAVAGDGADTVRAGAGSDYLQGNAGDDSLYGGDGSDRIFGGQDDDRIFGESGNDSINGNLGNDTIEGGAGNDSLRGGQGNDVLLGGEADDVLLGDRGTDLLLGDVGDDRLSGGADDDLLNGGEGDDTLAGDDGNDNLRGGAGDDVLAGNAGTDNLIGEGGRDIFVVAGGEIVTEGPTLGLVDIVSDFEDGVDRLLAASVVTVVFHAVMNDANDAMLIDYARLVLAAEPTAAVAIGQYGSTYLFMQQASGNMPDVVKLSNFDQALVTVGDFI